MWVNIVIQGYTIMPLNNFYTRSSFVLYNMVLVLHSVSSQVTLQVTPLLGYILSGWRVVITFRMGPTTGKLLVGFLVSQYLEKQFIVDSKMTIDSLTLLAVFQLSLHTFCPLVRRQRGLC